MATQGKIVTLFEDKEQTKGVFPRTKVSAISNNEGVGLDALLIDAICVGEDSENTQSLPVDADTLQGYTAEELMANGGGSLEPTGVTAGTYGEYNSSSPYYYIPNITVDEYGRITEASKNYLGLASAKSAGLINSTFYSRVFYDYHISSVTTTAIDATNGYPATLYLSNCKEKSIGSFDGATVYAPYIYGVYAYIHYDSTSSYAWVPINTYRAASSGSGRNAVTITLPEEYRQFNTGTIAYCVSFATNYTNTSVM